MRCLICDKEEAVLMWQMLRVCRKCFDKMRKRNHEMEEENNKISDEFGDRARYKDE